MEASVDQILGRVTLMSGIKEDAQALQALAGIMKIKTFPAAHTLITENEVGDEFYVLVQGQVSVFKKTPEGDAYKVVILKDEVTPAFGEGGLIEAEARSATVRCDTECRCLVLNRLDFQKFCQEYPAWAVPILRKLSMILIGKLRQTSNDLMLLHKALMNEIRE